MVSKMPLILLIHYCPACHCSLVDQESSLMLVLEGKLWLEQLTSA